MSNEVTTTNGTASNGIGSFEEKIREFQTHLKDLAGVQNVDELKEKWEHLSTQTREEVEQHPLQMIALGGMLGFSLGVVSKDVNVKHVSSRAIDWAAKLGAAWAVEKFTDKGSSKTEQPVH